MHTPLAAHCPDWVLYRPWQTNRVQRPKECQHCRWEVSQGTVGRDMSQPKGSYMHCMQGTKCSRSAAGLTIVNITTQHVHFQIMDHLVQPTWVERPMQRWWSLPFLSLLRKWRHHHACRWQIQSSHSLNPDPEVSERCVNINYPGVDMYVTNVHKIFSLYMYKLIQQSTNWRQGLR